MNREAQKKHYPLKRAEIQNICIDFDFDEAKIEDYLSQYEQTDKYKGLTQFEWNETVDPHKRTQNKIERSREQARLKSEKKRKEMLAKEREEKRKHKEEAARDREHKRDRNFKEEEVKEIVPV
eukprot:TRINITY_DN83175_c0_g1_i1.p2 TRINITY_DN83175_c0_g1~~TRINITY_DN83175_c0_g1_i1.p2  ORF type:complete len:123 (-),score=34.82 TRINITY_DN83175_c0_g1_i1:293-661(-)